jgi:hypothetical protein
MMKPHRHPMEINQVLELLERENIVPAGSRTSQSLSEAVELYSANRMQAVRLISQLQKDDPLGTAIAAMKLEASGKRVPGLQLHSSLDIGDDSLVEPLCSPGILQLDAAVSLAKKMVQLDPQLDIRVAARLRETGEQRTSDDLLLHILEILDAISDCSRLLTRLTPLLRHPNTRIRSKAARLIGRANLNVDRTRQLLASDDPRVRANAVESLWPCSPACIGVLREAVEDPHHRVRVNALVGLCHLGEERAFSQLEALAEDVRPIVRRAALWGMGKLGDRRFAATMTKSLEDPASSVRRMAERALGQLAPTEPETAVETEPEKSVETPDPACPDPPPQIETPGEPV